MLNRIIKFSLKNRALIVVSGVLLLAIGALVMRGIDVDVFPDLNAPTVVVMTEAHGMAPEEVERLVTFPIETAVHGAENVRRVRSNSAMGFSLVWVEFDWGMDVYNARQIVMEKLSQLGENLPEGISQPVLAPQSSLLGEIMIVSISSDSVDQMKLRTLADWLIRPHLLSIGGVAQVTVQGGDLKQYQVLADQQLMNYYGVSFEELLNAVQQSNENAAGGILNQYGNEYIIRGMGRTNQISEMEQLVIETNNKVPVKIEDVAEIKIEAAQQIGTGSYNASSAVVLTISKQPNINTLKLSENLDLALDEIENKLPDGVQLNRDIFKQSHFIKTSIQNVQKALLEGAVFVVIILLLFLMNLRTTLISVIAIPLSLIVSILTLKLLGLTINTMSLGGMAIAIGSIVDDAIIDVENVFKNLKRNRKLVLGNRKKTLRIIYEASKEIRASILNATLIIIVAFVPLFFLSGMEGRMLKPLGISFIVSLFASLIVAITITPVLCSYLLTTKKQLNQQEDGSFLTRKLLAFYKRTLKFVLKKHRIVIASASILFVVSVLIFTGFGRNFLPPFNEGSLSVNVSTKPGVSLAESDAIGKQAEEELLSIPEIGVTSRKTGRAELAEHSFGSNVSEIDVPFELTERKRDAFLEEVRQKLASISGITSSVGQPISHRIDHLLSGSRTNIAIKLFGTDLNEMYALALEIEKSIGQVAGVVDLNVEQQIKIPQLQVKPNREMLAAYGIPLTEFIHFVEAGIGGIKAGTVFEKEKSFDLIVRLQEEYRNKMKLIGDVLIDVPGGSKIPLSYIADVKSAAGPNTINRENVKRKLVISANVAGDDLQSVINSIKKQIDTDIVLPESYFIEYGGQFESAQKAGRILLFASILAIFIIFLILFQEFKNTRTAAIILLNLPLALIGGVVAIMISSGVVSIPSIIGFITLFGIATRNGILLVSRYQTLEKTGMKPKKIIIQGSGDRLLPILMTALTAALALIPLAVNGEKPGNEIQSPMAIVILGGLLSSTLLNLLVVPVIYYSLILKKK